jgi:hypothetical protein
LLLPGGFTGFCPWKRQEAAIYGEEGFNYRGIEWGLGWAFIRDANGQNAFSNLSRYETATERGLYKALHELQRLQADRAPAGSIPPPVAVDVDAPEIPEGISERLALFGNNRI